MLKRGCFSALFLLFVTAPLFAISYVVPTDRFEIERSSAIIVGRVLSSHVERSPQFGIETVTDVVLEEAIKGTPGFVVQIHEPGGVLGDEARFIAGVPSFASGDRVMLFLYQRGNGEYTVCDLALGSFLFVKDVDGHELLIRDASELGRNVDGSEHREPHRAAERFVEYIRAVIRGDALAEDYAVPARPLAGASKTPELKSKALHPISNTVFTATSYTSTLDGTETGPGGRWNVFPSAVNWNQGNTEPGAPGSPAGSFAIGAAFGAWNSGGGTNSPHYVQASTTANTKGILDATDGVNNIVFEKDLTGAGAMPFASCSGVLGIGGISQAFGGGGAHVFHGETFDTIIEGDVSMNQGVQTCAALLASGDWNTAVTHEVGHTLGFRHWDQTRLNDPHIGCASDLSLDCSGTQAVMRSFIPNGINAHLQPWDVAAVVAVYGTGATCTAPSITQQPTGSTIASGGSAMLSVTAGGTPTFSYQWYVGNPTDTSQPVAGGTNSSVTVSPTTTTTYWVRVTGQCAPPADSNAATVTVTVCAPPSITQQPTGATIAAGASAMLSVAANGSPTLTYQWYVGSTGNTAQPVAGGTGTSVTVSPTTTTTYWVRVTGQCAPTADSTAATVTVTPCIPPSITQQPTGSTITAGNTAMLSVTAGGSAPLTYQWYVGTPSNTAQPVAGGTSASIIVNPTTTTTYWVRVSGPCAPTADSNAATVTVNQPVCHPPSITLEPSDQSVVSGNSANLFVGYVGTTATITWYRGTPTDTSQPIGTGQSLQSPTLTTTTTFWARITNGCGSADSRGALITVTLTCTAPAITSAGANPSTVQAAQLTTLTVVATGTSLSYQWYKGQSGDTSTPISGATTPSITDSPTATTNYWVRVSSGCGAQPANSGTITVTVGPACQLPTITTAPLSQSIVANTSTTLTVVANTNGSGTLHYAWFQGLKNDTSKPVGIDSPSFFTGGLSATTKYWVRVTNDCGSVSSDTVTVTTEKLRRRPSGR